jgi:ATP-dependent helicase/nuclease subunit A
VTRGESTEALRVADQEARLAAQTVFDRPVVLEAGAGTGKTAALVARAVAWCVGHGWKHAEDEARARPILGTRSDGPERIAIRVLDGLVAITFTEAAAAEMASRVGEAFRALAADEPVTGLEIEALELLPHVVQERSRALLVSLDHLTVSTIHAFCRRLLASSPLDAGLHPAFTVDADDAELEAIVRETVEDSLGALFGEPANPDVLALAAARHGPQALADALVTLIKKGVGAAALERDPFAPEIVRALLDDIRDALASFDASSAEALVNGEKAEAALTELRASLPRKPSADQGVLENVCACARSAFTVLEDRLEKWVDGNFGVRAAKRLGERAAAAAAASGTLRDALETLAPLQPSLYGHARRALAPLAAEVWRRLRVRGVETFDCLLTDARDLLREHPEIAARERSEIRQLLVDEFQDTDPVQCEVLELLALTGPDNERPGLFLVGDPKQSIFGWRSADLAAYDGFVERALQAGGKRYQLSVSFRSAPAILDEVARVVAPLMHQTSGLQPAFSELVPSPQLASHSGFASGASAPVEYWVSWLRPTEGTRADEASELEAAAVARDLRRLHDEHGVPWRECGLLMRTTGSIELYLRALRDADVPFLVERDRSYYRRREIIDVAAFVRVVLDRSDELALVTWLRSPWVGVPDGALLPLWRRRVPAALAELRGPDPALLERIAVLVNEAAAMVSTDIPGIEALADWPHALIAAVERLAELRLAWRREPAARFVEHLRSASLLEVGEAARTLGSFRLANLKRFFRELEGSIETSAWDRDAVLRFLRVAVLEGLEREESRPNGGADDAVRVLTIHKAKGLEFGHVYLLETHRGVRGGAATKVDAGHLGADWELVLFGAPSPGWAVVKRRRRQVSQAELVRNLYVALTRAKERLVVCGSFPIAGRAARSGSLVELLKQRAPASSPLAELANELAQGPSSYRDCDGARWVFPAFAQAKGMLRERAPVVDWPAPTEVRRQSLELADRRVAAEQRSARPFVGRMSEAAHAALHAQEPADSDEELVISTEPRVERSARVATEVGCAIHRVLATIDFTADLASAFAGAANQMHEVLVSRVPTAQLATAEHRARALLTRLAEAPLLNRLQRIAAHILARELALLAPPTDTDSGPVGFSTGAADLVYRDPDDGVLVVADFKTDMLAGDDEIRARSAVYSSQLRAYVDALHAALRTPRRPRAELWFVAAGRIVEV